MPSLFLCFALEDNEYGGERGSGSSVPAVGAGYEFASNAFPKNLLTLLVYTFLPPSRNASSPSVMKSFWQRNMPFISTPTQTTDRYRPGDHITQKEPPAITAPAREDDQSSFLLGVNTCGFTTGTTITCEYGYECTNVDDYRGCCAAGSNDCSATIHTSCLDYSLMPNAEMCGPHTLCCPLTKGYCMTYAFSTEDQPGATLTHVKCAVSPGFGELYPYPPELRTTSEDLPNTAADNTTSTLIIQPVHSGSSSSGSVSTGAIAGAVVGGIVLIILAAVGGFLIASRKRRTRRRRQQQQQQQWPEGKERDELRLGSAALGDNNMLAGRVRPLSTIPENLTPSPDSTSPTDKLKLQSSSTSGSSSVLRPHSSGPTWPLGPDSPRNPLGSHPVTEMDKRFSLRETSTEPQNNVPILGVPSPRPPGTRLAPPPPPPLKRKKVPNPSTTTDPSKSPRPVSKGGSPTSIITGLGLQMQSPRLSYVPVSPIDGALNVPVPVPVPVSSTPSSSSLGSVIPYHHPDPDSPVSPVSPLDDDDDDEEDVTPRQRISLVSAASGGGEGQEKQLENLVSPISPGERGSSSLGGHVSPLSDVTVSPPDSRRGSLEK
ncbi:hypothetical protein GGS20DRAFT_589435 [Poronia punctata]|nr:hypothetical protein GGS20DRAFT_589435 [Poronia punctata]